MKALLLSLCLVCFALPAVGKTIRPVHAHKIRIKRAGPVHVRGTITRRSQYRQPHYRTAPNHTQRDNWSTKGNVNPYTGKSGHKRVHP